MRTRLGRHGASLTLPGAHDHSAPAPRRADGCNALRAEPRAMAPTPQRRGLEAAQCQSLSRRSSQRRSWSSMKESQPRFSSRLGVFAWRAGPVTFGRDRA